MKKDILVFIEQRDGEIESVGYELCGIAYELAKKCEGAKVCAAIIGDNSKEQANKLLNSGADEIYYVENPVLKYYLNETYTDAFASVAKLVEPNVILIGASSIGRDLAPRVSARLNTGLTADCTILELDEEGQLYSTRPAFGGNLFATIICPDHRPQMSTVRPGVMKKVHVEKDDVKIIEHVVEFNKPVVEVLEYVVEKKEVEKIDDAKVLVSLGRGCANEASITKATELASLLGGTTSCSRALVDKGMMDHAKQVGQTGTTVRPELYVALGISGAIQHVAGMEGSDFKIAINKDKTAAIFNACDMGIVGDANAILPALVEELKKL